MYKHILIDGKNAIYKAIFAARSPGANGVHPATIMIRQIGKLKRLFNPENWHVFWDVPSQTLWRRDILPTYKDGRDTKDHGFDVKAEIRKTQDISVLLFNLMGITQYVKEKNEADDLIYAFVVSHPDDKCLVVSSDADMTQLPYHLNNVDVHNPRYKESDILPKPELDPVVVKSLAGDNSDNIDGYRMVAEITAGKLIRGNRLDDFFKSKGKEIYDRNVSIIDLSKNPYVEDNIKYINDKTANTKFDMVSIRNMISKHELIGMSDEMGKISSFKRN